MKLMSFKSRTAWRPYTAKDYVQDGLVAMWDGIENAGFGLHDGAATVWNDLIGGGNITSLTSSWADDHLVFMRKSGEIAKVPFPAIDSGEISVEMVVQLLDGTEATGRYLGTNALETSSRCIEIDTNNFASVRFSWQRPNNGFANRVITKAVSGADRHSFTLSLSGTSQRACVNGGAMTSLSAYVPDVSIFSRHTARLGEYSNTSLANMNVFSIRIYSRVLTTAEIAANYAIDCARFKIGGAE